MPRPRLFSTSRHFTPSTSYFSRSNPLSSTETKFQTRQTNSDPTSCPEESWLPLRTPREYCSYHIENTIHSANTLYSKTYTLNTGAQIPAIGLGTWQSGPNEVSRAVETALRNGYRHIDTAAAYGNEREVGDGIRASGVPREQIFLTTKLDNPWHKRAPEALANSLAALQTDYLDLYLMHWPSSTDPSDLKKHYPDWDFVDTWREMQKLLDTGKVRAIGVSNFAIKNMEKLLNAESTKVSLQYEYVDFHSFHRAVLMLTISPQITPAVNQIELHPCNPSPKLIAYLQSKNIHPSAYSPLGSTDSPLGKNKALLSIAESKGKSPQQVLLAWGLQKGFSVLPKSVTPSRIQANFELDGWSLTEEEVAALDSIEERFKVCGDSWLPVKVFFGDEE